MDGLFCFVLSFNNQAIYQYFAQAYQNSRKIYKVQIQNQSIPICASNTSRSILIRNVSQNSNIYNHIFICSMDDCAQKALISILNKAKNENCYEKALAKSSLDYQLKPYNIMKLHPDKILQIYRQIRKKFYSQPQVNESDFWVENQLRIFVWIVAVFTFVELKPIEEFNQNHWNMLSEIFNNKTSTALQFQALCLTRLKKSRKWLQEETDLLDAAIRERSQKNKWNEIAKAIFIASDRKYFRTPKQCRQQWLNHLDPTKTKSQWTLIEDYLLIKSIISNGRRWSKVAKQLGNRRTEHMVKNRYKSLLNAEIKRLLDVNKQEILIAKIKQRLQSSSSVRRYLNEQTQKSTKKAVVDKPELVTKIPDRQEQPCSMEEDLEGSSSSCSQSKASSSESAKLLQQSEIEAEIENNIKNQQGQDQKNMGQKWGLKQQPEIDDLDVKQFFNADMLDKLNLEFFTEYSELRF